MFMVMRANILSTTTIYKALVIFAVLAFVGGTVFAATESELRNKANELAKQKEAGQAQLDVASAEVNTLEEKVAALQAEISAIQGQIDQTNADIERTEAELVKTEAELNRQKNIMNESIRTLYKKGDISTVELIAASDNFTEFVNGQEYLERVKLAVQESAEKVAELKEKLEEDKKALDELLELQIGQQKVVAAKKAEEDELLQKAKDTEFSYSQHVDALQAQQDKAEKELEAYLIAQASKGFNSIGVVNNNQIVGYTGSTGNSTGAHLHFGLWDPGSSSYIDPVANRSTQTLKYGFSWPYSSYQPVSRWYDCTRFWAAATRPWCPSPGYFHAGVDIAAPSGTPVHAVAPGNIIYKGYWGGGGYTVMIQHANGLISRYLHMQPF